MRTGRNFFSWEVGERVMAVLQRKKMTGTISDIMKDGAVYEMLR